ncbi:hypothetical protein WMY93_033509 [Mugilogobius chulae]|uniref:Endonuclease/exonuclease/phosphatase domain-containing protein n=1 Tax=Mugilogobius chulae TaxID=88201 RepID=A0AAW0MGW5_9GOBI
MSSWSGLPGQLRVVERQRRRNAYRVVLWKERDQPQPPCLPEMFWCCMTWKSLYTVASTASGPWYGSAELTLLLAAIVATRSPNNNVYGSSVTSAFKRMSTHCLPSAWKLWIILACVVVIHLSPAPAGLWLTTSAAGATPRTMLLADSSTHLRRPQANISPLQLDLPRRPRYIHRGSGRRFILSKQDDHSSITSHWSAVRSVAQQMRQQRRHQSTATAATDRALRPIRKPGVDYSVLRSLNKLDSKTFVILEQLNVQSLSNKSGLIHDHILDKEIDIMCLTETWQQPDVYSVLNEACPPGYSYLEKARTTGRGGGLAVFYRSSMELSPLSVPNVNSFESMVFKCKFPFSAAIALIYRPPKAQPTFISDIHDFLISLCTSYKNILVIGDLNIHMDSHTSKLGTDFKQVLDCLNLQQLVDGPTHKKGHTLDLVITDSIPLTDLHIYDIGTSDHQAVNIKIPQSSQFSKPKRHITFRNIKNIDPASFTQHLQLLSSPPSSSVSDLIDYYNNSLSHILDTHAPLKSRTVTFTRPAPWYTTKLRDMKRSGRVLEELVKHLT